MKWTPLGKDSKVVVEGFRKGCGGGHCIHVTANIAMGPKEAHRLAKSIVKAIIYAEGGK